MIRLRFVGAELALQKLRRHIHASTGREPTLPWFDEGTYSIEVDVTEAERDRLLAAGDQDVRAEQVHQELSE